MNGLELSQRPGELIVFNGQGREGVGALLEVRGPGGGSSVQWRKVGTEPRTSDHFFDHFRVPYIPLRVAIPGAAFYPCHQLIRQLPLSVKELNSDEFRMVKMFRTAVVGVDWGALLGEAKFVDEELLADLGMWSGYKTCLGQCGNGTRR